MYVHMETGRKQVKRAWVEPVHGSNGSKCIFKVIFMTNELIIDRLTKIKLLFPNYNVKTDKFIT